MTVGNTEEVKERLSMSLSLLNGSVKDYERAEKKHTSSVRFLTHISEVLDALPERSDDWNLYSSITVFYDGPHVTVNYSTSGEEDSNTIRGMVQRVMKMPAIREVSTFSGDILWAFDKDYKDPDDDSENGRSLIGCLRITINHGRLAPGCEVVEEEKTMKQFRIVCPEGYEETADEN